jgi:hypothetical protein
MMMNNEMVIVKKMYRVFDELHSSLDLAQNVLKGWEHKEGITTVYAVGYESKLNHTSIPQLDGIYLARTLEEAQEEAKEWNA